MMEAVSTSETSVNIETAAGRNILEDRHLHAFSSFMPLKPSGNYMYHLL
jgi:hypothetical protein